MSERRTRGSYQGSHRDEPIPRPTGPGANRGPTDERPNYEFDWRDGWRETWAYRLVRRWRSRKSSRA